jgi:rod shape-determining protein MreD
MKFERSKELLKPVSHRFMLLTVLFIVLLELFPVSHCSRRWLPDYIGMLILYWVINQPRRFNIGKAFLLGLVADVFHAGLFGQHSLAYSITAYLALRRQRQVVMFNLSKQTLVVLVLLLINQLIILLGSMLSESPVVGMDYFLPSVFGALLWPLLTKLMLIPYRHNSV